MKKTILLLLLLLFAAYAGFAQSKQRPRSPYFHPTTTTRPSHDDRGNAPANDDCANAQVVTVATDCSAPIVGDNSQATTDGPDASCDDPGSALMDVWYTFNAGAEDTIAITLLPSAQMSDWDMVVYDACGGTELTCRIDPAAPVYQAVTPGANYWVRIYSNPTYGTAGAFSLCIAQPGTIAPPPANDDCANSTPQPLNVGTSMAFNGTTVGATENDGLGYPIVWESFTLTTCADVKVSYCGTTPTWSGFWIVLYTSCPPVGGVFASSYDSTACGDGNFTLCFPKLDPGTYYYPVVQAYPVVGPYTLNVSAAACGEELASNDECDGAIPLTAHPTCETAFFTNPCATQSLPAITCGTFTGDASDDVWYSFTATSTDMTVGGAPHGNMDIVMELFSGTCASLTSIACGDVGGPGVADDLIASGLTVGNTYYFRVYDFRTLYSYTYPGYDLCVVDGQGSGVGLAEEASISEQGALFPNPSNGQFTIRVASSVTSQSVQVIDAAGRTVRSTTERASGGLVHVDASGLMPGAYVVRYTDGAHMMNERLIIQ